MPDDRTRTMPLDQRFTDIRYQTTRVETACWWIALVLLAFFLTALQMTITESYRLTTLELMANFQAVEPFQHRVLVPALVAACRSILPLDQRLLFAVFEILTWIALVLVAERALIVFRVTDRPALRKTLAMTILVPVAVIALVPDLELWPAFTQANGLWDVGDWGARILFYYPYDLPAAVFTLALLLALIGVRQHTTPARVAGLVALFAVATVNRETTVLVLPMMLLLFNWRHDYRRLLSLLLLLLVVFVAVQWPLLWLFSDQPNPNRGVGSTQYEWHVWENWRYLTQPFYLLAEVVRFLGGLWLPVLLWWRFVDRRLKAAVIGFALPLAVLCFVIGRLPEHRVFIEAVPILWIAAIQALMSRLQGPVTTAAMAGHG